VRRRLLIVAIFLGWVGLAAAAETRLRELRSGEETAGHLLYLPSGKYLRALAPGYQEILADSIYLWSLQYYAKYQPAERGQYLDHIYTNVITELDPHYRDPYLIGALIMVFEAKDIEMGIRLLDKGIKANPDDWVMAFEAGFYCYDTLHDYNRAARYFQIAMAVPGAHPIIRRLHAEMFNKAGDTRTSLKYWLEIYETAEDEHVASVSFRHIHDLRIRLDIEELERAIGIFEEMARRKPSSLEELVKVGILRAVPQGSSGEPYKYNRNTGEVRSSVSFKLKPR
jgi:tetratricopeptide (TPR) repeat protein